MSVVFTNPRLKNKSSINKQTQNKWTFFNFKGKDEGWFWVSFGLVYAKCSSSIEMMMNCEYCIHNELEFNIMRLFSIMTPILVYSEGFRMIRDDSATDPQRFNDPSTSNNDILKINNQLLANCWFWFSFELSQSSELGSNEQGCVFQAQKYLLKVFEMDAGLMTLSTNQIIQIKAFIRKSTLAIDVLHAIEDR